MYGPTAWVFRDFQGTHGAGQVLVQGRSAEPDERRPQPGVYLEMTGRNLALDAEPVGRFANDPIRNESIPWQGHAFAAATTAVTSAFNPTGWCPAYKIPQEIALAVAEKNRRDESQMAELVSRGTSVVPVQTERDGGMYYSLFRTGPLASDGN